MRSTIRISSGIVSKTKKWRDVSFPDSSGIIRNGGWDGLYKAANEELEVEESKIKSRLREFTLEDPDEFIDLDSEEIAFTGDKRKLYGIVHPSCMRLADATHRNGTNWEWSRKRSRWSSSAGKRRVDLWWEVMQCDQFVGNGYPTLQRSPSDHGAPPFATLVRHSQDQSTSRPRRKRRKEPSKENSHPSNKMILGPINKNITMRHFRVILQILQPQESK